MNNRKKYFFCCDNLIYNWYLAGKCGSLTRHPKLNNSEVDGNAGYSTISRLKCLK